MKRQRGRGRKPGHQNNSNRAFESNGPDVKIRGNAQHIYEKYLQLARDSSSSGDRVMAENYYQHAEHYLRIVQLTQPRRDDSDHDDDRPSERQNDRQPERHNERQNERQGGGERQHERAAPPQAQRHEQPRFDPQPRQDHQPRPAAAEVEGQRPRGNGLGPNGPEGHNAPRSESESAENANRQRRQRGRRRRSEDDHDSAGADPLAVVDPEAASASAQVQSVPEPAGEPASEQPAPKRARTRRPRADSAAEDALKAAGAKSNGGAAA